MWSRLVGCGDDRVRPALDGEPTGVRSAAADKIAVGGANMQCDFTFAPLMEILVLIRYVDPRNFLMTCRMHPIDRATYESREDAVIGDA